MLRPGRLRVVATLTLSLAAILLAACEGIVVETVESGSPTPSAASETAQSGTPSATETTPAGTVPVPATVPRSPVSGGRPLPSTTPGAGVRPTESSVVRPQPTRPAPVTTAAATATGSSGGRGGSGATGDLTDLSRFTGGTLTGVDGVSLGLIKPAGDAFDSICDNVGVGGAAFGANSIFNDQSPYGGPFGANSPFNPESAAPPKIVVDSQVTGHLSVSPFVADPVDPFALLKSLGCPASPG